MFPKYGPAILSMGGEWPGHIPIGICVLNKFDLFISSPMDASFTLTT